MKNFNIFIIAIFSLYMASCEEINNNPLKGPGISIVSALNTGGDKQYVKVCYLSDLSENGKYDSLVVRDAEIKLIGDNFLENMTYNELSYQWTSQKEYFYETTNSMKDKILPGNTYRLYVKSGNYVVNGITTFPGEFHIISHKNNDTINPYEKFNLSWSKSNNSYLYIVQYYCIYKLLFEGKTYYENSWPNQIITRDTLLELSYFPYVINDGSPGTAIPLYGFIKVIAVDKNYYDHKYLMRDRVGLDAGYGCFSSGVVDTVRLYYKK
jgi:hypothetical protein